MPRNKRKPKYYAQYQKEYERITQAIRRQINLGYAVPDKLKPVKPSEMKTIRKRDVTRLSKITPQKIREKSFYGDPETGEVLPGYDVVKERRKRRKRKSKTDFDEFFYSDIEYAPEGLKEYYPDFDNVAINSYLEKLSTFPNAKGAEILRNWINRLIESSGRHNVAIMLDNASKAGVDLTWMVAYGYNSQLQGYLTQMLDYLPGITPDEKYNMFELMENMESWEPPI